MIGIPYFIGLWLAGPLLRLFVSSIVVQGIGLATLLVDLTLYVQRRDDVHRGAVDVLFGRRDEVGNDLAYG